MTFYNPIEYCIRLIVGFYFIRWCFPEVDYAIDNWIESIKSRF